MDEVAKLKRGIEWRDAHIEFLEAELRVAVEQEKGWRRSSQTFSSDSENHAAEAVRLTQVALEAEAKAQYHEEQASKVLSGSRAGGASTAKRKEASLVLIRSLFDEAAKIVTTDPKHTTHYRSAMCLMVSRMYTHRWEAEVHQAYKIRHLPGGRTTYNRVFGNVFKEWAQANGLATP